MTTNSVRSALRTATVAVGLVAVGANGCGPDDEIAISEEGLFDASGRPRISLPANKSTLNAQVVTFTWSNGADEYWLRIGSKPHRFDIYDSGSLRGATSHTVTNLPLDGERFYVELRSRFGRKVVATTNRYTAGVRKGLAIVVDFANFRLEDYQEPPDVPNPGFHTMADVRAMLDLMTDHWSFLSRGRERVQWDLIRVQLDQNLAPDAYPHIREFREAVMAAADVAVSDYDVNADGVLDSVWMIVSAGDAQGGDPGYDFLHGGALRLSGVASFLDSQASGSVRNGFYGNFNHEFGHNSGLPDLYGLFSNVNGLTVMGATSSRVPADDFTSFERERLGWLRPMVVRQTKLGVVLPSAHQTMAAVKIPTARSYEYFLIEYRMTPERGYGSLAQPYDGLAVYHVFLPSITQRINPPILKLEAADNILYPGEPTPMDMFYPGNPVMDLSRAMRSYVTNQPIFELQNVRWMRNGIAFDVVILGDGGAIDTPNLLQNPSFEQVAGGVPSFWSPDGEGAVLTQEVTHSGTYGAQIASETPADIAWHQLINYLVSARPYLFCGWVQGENIVRYQDENDGSTIVVITPFDRFPGEAGIGTFDWRETCVAFAAATSRADLMCRLGGPSSTTTGTMWCDDLSLHQLNRAF